jgi:hypothetical protein
MEITASAKPLWVFLNVFMPVVPLLIAQLNAWVNGKLLPMPTLLRDGSLFIFSSSVVFQLIFDIIQRPTVFGIGAVLFAICWALIVTILSIVGFQISVNHAYLLSQGNTSPVRETRLAMLTAVVCLISVAPVMWTRLSSAVFWGGQ